MQPKAQQTERSLETVIEINAPVEAVWKAISDAQQITRWLAPEAKVEPGPNGSMAGGTMWISWGEGAEGTSTIEIWEPNQRLQTVTEREGAYDPGGTYEEVRTGQPPIRMLVDYILEARGGTTILRLVHSGFGRGAEWDAEYDATRKGWPTMLRVLKHGLEFHPDEPVGQVSVSALVSMTPAELWSRLKSDSGEALEVTLDETEPEGYVSGVIENWNRSLIAIYGDCKPGEKSRLTVIFVLYGPMVEQAEAIKARWTQMLAERFPA